jgi:hypothetical protein
MKRAIVALNPPRRVNDLRAKARFVASRLSEDPLFSPPQGLVPLLEARELALEAAVLAVERRTAGGAAARKARQGELLDALAQARSYVQSVASGKPAAEASMAIVRAGLDVKDTQGPRRKALAVKPGPVSGTARVYAKAVKDRASYEWQLASDEGENGDIMCVSLAPTRRSKTQLHGLVPGALYWVRVRSLTGAGLSNWSERVGFRAA